MAITKRFHLLDVNFPAVTVVTQNYPQRNEEHVPFHSLFQIRPNCKMLSYALLFSWCGVSTQSQQWAPGNVSRRHTFAIHLEVDNDRLHGTLTVPPQALACPPAHFPHEELPHTSRHWSCPEELILNNKHNKTGRLFPPILLSTCHFKALCYFQFTVYIGAILSLLQRPYSQTTFTTLTVTVGTHFEVVFPVIIFCFIRNSIRRCNLLPSSAMLAVHCWKALPN